MLSTDALVNGIRFGMCGYTAADGQDRPYSQRFIKSIKWNLQQPEWQPDPATWEKVERKQCTDSTETSLSYKKNTGCDGWSGQTLQQCHEHCAQNDVASGCTAVHGDSVCSAFVHYERTGWCHVSSACDSLLIADTAMTYIMKLNCTGCAEGYVCDQIQGTCMPSSTQQEPHGKENAVDEIANNRSQINPTSLTDEDSQTSPDQLGSKSAGNSGRIIGIVVAAVFVLVGLFVLFCWKCKQAKEAAMTKELKGAKTTAYNNPQFNADPNSRCQQCGTKTTQCICRQRAESIAQGNIPKIAGWCWCWCSPCCCCQSWGWWCAHLRTACMVTAGTRVSSLLLERGCCAGDSSRIRCPERTRWQRSIQRSRG